MRGFWRRAVLPMVAAAAFGAALAVAPSPARAQVASACDDVPSFCSVHLGRQCRAYADSALRDTPVRCVQQLVYWRDCQEMAAAYCSGRRVGRRDYDDDAPRGGRDGSYGRGGGYGGYGGGGWASYTAITTQQAGAVRAGQYQQYYIAHPGGCMIIAGEAFEPGSALTISVSGSNERLLDMTPGRDARLIGQIELGRGGYLATVSAAPSRGSSFRFLIGSADRSCQTRASN